MKTSLDRKEYMKKLLSPYEGFLDVCFVEAVDGRNLSKKQLMKIWNQDKAYKTYGRYMKGGEIGCALSHRKCYEEIWNNHDDVALILEDDVSFQDVDMENIIFSVSKILKIEKPIIVLLSGDYWYIRKQMVVNGLQLVTVREAMGAIAYLMNRSAAKIMMSAEKRYLADDWYNLKKKGITLYALYSHVVDTSALGTTISGDGYAGTIRKNLSFPRMLHSYWRAIIRQVLGRNGHFEKRI